MSPTCGLCETQLHGTDADRYLCEDCEAATAGRLAALPLLYADLAQFLSPGSPAAGPRSSTRSVTASLPVAESVLGLRGPGGIVGVLEDWRAALHQDRGWTAPPVRGSFDDRVARAAKGLRDNLPWASAAWPVVGAMAEEIHTLQRDALTVVAPDDPAEKGVRLGNCPASVDGVVCGAVLRHYPGRPLECRWCGARYEQEDWLNVASWMRRDEEEAGNAA